jgi:hypothetical protein
MLASLPLICFIFFHLQLGSSKVKVMLAEPKTKHKACLTSHASNAPTLSNHLQSPFNASDLVTLVISC